MSKNCRKMLATEQSIYSLIVKTPPGLPLSGEERLSP